MLKLLITCLAIIALSGCGVVYISPKVQTASGNVEVVSLTSETVISANKTVYRPKEIPDAFFRNAGTRSSARGRGVSPPLPTQLEPQNRPSLVSRLPPPAIPGSYRIGIGDVIVLATKTSGSSVEELSGLLAAQNSRQGYTVQDDGAIAVPDVGRVFLANLSLEEADARLFEALVEQQINPAFSIEIAEFNSKRVALGGAVVNPTLVPITLIPLYLDEVLARGGGLSTPDVDYATIRIYRGGTIYQIPLTEYLSNAQLQKTLLVAGDSVFVDTDFELEKARSYFEEQITLAQFRQQDRTQALAELQTGVTLLRNALAEERSNFQERVLLDSVDRDYVYLTGEVNQPGRFAMPFQQQTTLADALFSEGGFSAETGNPSQIYVLRTAEDNPTTITALHLDGRNVVNMVLATKLNLQANDIVFIAEQPITRWNRVVRQLVPSLLNTGVAAANN